MGHPVSGVYSRDHAKLTHPMSCEQVVYTLTIVLKGYNKSITIILKRNRDSEHRTNQLYCLYVLKAQMFTIPTQCSLAQL
jgi:hypothetical protein